MDVKLVILWLSVLRLTPSRSIMADVALRFRLRRVGLKQLVDTLLL